MKKLLLFTVILFFFFQVKGQDIIIKNAGDTFRCKITSIDSFNIYVSFKKGSYQFNSFVDRREVKAYYYNAYDITPKIKTAADWKYPKVSVNFNGGAGYFLSKDPIPPIIGELSDADKKLYDNLRLGLGYGGDLKVYFLQFLGIGVKYNFYQSRNNMDEVSRELYQYQYIGPSICFMGIMLNKTSIAHFAITGGKLYLKHLKDEDQTIYSDDSTSSVTIKGDYTIKGETYAYGGTVGFDFLFDESVALGIESTILFGEYKKLKISTPDTRIQKSETIDFPVKYKTSRVDVCIGLKFYF